MSWSKNSIKKVKLYNLLHSSQPKSKTPRLWWQWLWLRSWKFRKFWFRGTGAWGPKNQGWTRRFQVFVPEEGIQTRRFSPFLEGTRLVWSFRVLAILLYKILLLQYFNFLIRYFVIIGKLIRKKVVKFYLQVYFPYRV